MKKKYFTEEERIEARKESIRQWRKRNPEYDKQYHQAHKKDIIEYKKKYDSTQKGRATNLVWGYKKLDKKHNRGECTLTSEWVVNNIFTQPCHYCGETDWHKLGCDRIDNSKPHTPDNVVCSCWECNIKKGKIPYNEYMKKLGDSPVP